MNADGVVTNAGGTGMLGFIPRYQPSVIQGFLGTSTLAIAPGVDMLICDNCDVWARFAGGALVNQKVYASFADGSCSAAATGAAAAATSTTFSITAGTFSTTASVANGVLSVTVVGSGTLYPGAIIAGTGIITGTAIAQQLSGTTGGVGTYELTIDDGQFAASETITGTYGLLTLGGTVTGVYSIGDTLTATGAAAGTIITANATNGASPTSTGGAGTAVVNLTQAISTGTVTAATNVETVWYVKSYAGAGELAMISTRHGI